MEENADSRLIQVGDKKLRQYGFSFAIGMLVLSALGYWKEFPYPILIVTSSLCVIHFGLAVLRPRWLAPFYRVVDFIGHLIGQAVTFVAFTLLFYLLFTPISLLLKLFGKDVIRNETLKNGWTDVPPDANSPERMKKQF